MNKNNTSTEEYADNKPKPSSEDLSIKEIIIRHVRKIADISCREFTGGYWQKKPINLGSGVVFTEVYHEDVRAAYCNAVDFLIDIIYPLGGDSLKEYLIEFEGFIDKNSKETTTPQNKEEDIKLRLKLKRQTFRQINIMFESTNFLKDSAGFIQ